MESLSHMTARHDYNWAKVAPQVARVRLIMAEFWGAFGALECILALEGEM